MTTRTSFAIKPGATATSSRVSVTLRGASRLLRTQVWLWPLVAAGFLATIGWWVQRSIEHSMQQHYQGQLQALLAVDAIALETWFKNVERDAAEIAKRNDVRAAAIELVPLANAMPPGLDLELRKSPQYERAQQVTLDRIKDSPYDDFLLISADGCLLISGDNQLVGLPIPADRKEFIDRVIKLGPLVSRPTISLRPIVDADGQTRTGVPVMIVAAPVLDPENKPIAVLGLRMRPDAEFCPILTKAEFGESGETYAFNEKGQFLSRSRFEKELKIAGVLADKPEVTSILNLDLRDPGVNLMRGERSTLSRSDMPLTRVAEDAIDGTSGVTVDGARDYRGVPTIAAWTWLKRYNLGLATKVDYDEAFAPLYIVRRFIWFLIGLLGLGAIAIYGFMIVVHRQQRELQRVALSAKQLGQYSLQEKIGAGGMGTVYRARHQFLRRATAVKLLDVEKMSENAVTRFEREVQLTSQLSHPNTIAIYDYGRTEEGLFYYVMELLDGLNLDDLVRKHGPQPEGRVVSILQQVCGSLAEAHAAGLIHRDIKPANIYLTTRGGIYDFVKVLDFGLAKDVSGTDAANVTAASSLTGTPLYLAPETIHRSEVADARSDVYAIGAVGYFLITGTTVFRAGTIMDILGAHMNETPQSLTERLGQPVDPTLERLLLRCLAKDPNERPTDAAELLADLGFCDQVRSWNVSDAKNWWRRGDATMVGGPTVEGSSTTAVLDRTIVLDK